MNDWKSARDWAAEDLPGLSTIREAVSRLAKLQQWHLLGPTKARQRSGRGGGWEYHITCLPEAAQIEWSRRQRAAEATQIVAHQQAEVATRAAALPAAIDARRREIMDARAAVVIEIERRAREAGSANRAVVTLLADARTGALTPAFAALMGVACDRKRGAFPSRTQIFEWLAAYRASGLTALLPGVRRQEARQDHPAWLTGFLRFLGRPSKPTIAQALEGYMAALPDPSAAPSYDQVLRALRALAGTERHLERFKGREGPLALKARLGFIRRTIEGMDLATVYTADGKTFDAMVAHPIHGRPFRPEITTVVDVVTRRVVGWSVGLKENTIGVADALRNAVEVGGICAIFYTDRGAGYRNEALDHDTLGMCARLGITTAHSLPYNSQARGVMERVNGTIWNKLSKDFVTYMGADMDREAGQRVWRQVSRDVKETGASRHLPSWQEFLNAVQAAIDAYNSAPHTSLKLRDPATGRLRPASPNEVWADFEERGFMPAHLDPGEADELFRPHFIRTVARGEVRWNNNRYAHPALEPYHEMDVMVGVDIHDAQHVWVRRIDIVGGDRVPGALICKADFYHNKAHYFPQSFQQAAEEKRARGRQRRVEVKLQEIAAEARGNLLIEHAPVVPTTLGPPPIDAVEVAAPRSAVAAPPAPEPRRIHADVAMAIEILAGRQELTPGRARNIREMLDRSSGRELMRMSGVDLDALRQLLRSAA